MSTRMNAFNTIVESHVYRGPNGVQPNGTPATPQPSECSDTTQMIMAFLNIGGQVAMAAAQAKVQGQNQAALNNNAAINNAMNGAQEALIKLPAGSAEYTKLQDQIAEIDKQLEALKNLDANREKQEEMTNTFGNAQVEGKSLLSVTEAITSCTNASSDLNGFLSQLETLNSSYEKNKAIATKEETVQFSTCIENPPTLSIKTINNENFYTDLINNAHSNGAYKKKSGDKEVVLESLYKADLAQAKVYDKALSEKLKAEKQYKEIGGEDGQSGKLAQLWQKINTTMSQLTLDPNVKSELGLDGSICNAEQLKGIISKLDQHAQSLGNKQIMDASGQPINDENGKPVTVANYLENQAELKSQIDQGEKAQGFKEGDKTGRAALEAKKAALEGQLTKEAKPKLDKLAEAYKKLKTLVAAIDIYDKEKGDIKTAQQGYRDVKSAEDRNLFQKCFGLGKTDEMKHDRALARGRIDSEKKEASTAKQNFVNTYGAEPSDLLRANAEAQMKVIQNAVKQAGLEEFAKKSGFDFGLDA